MKSVAFGFAFLVAFSICSGQEVRIIGFEPSLGDVPVELGLNYSIHGTDSVSFETLRFYVSSVKLLNQGADVWSEEASYHLLDAAISSSMRISLPSNVSADELVFFLGTDSLTNVSGAMGGDLDPSKGMYWAWNSGYINFKLEGTSSTSDTRNHEFQFHLGGYAFPNATVQEVHLALSNSTVIKIDLGSFLKDLDLKNLNHIMSPSSKAAELAQKASTIFRFSNED